MVPSPAEHPARSRRHSNARASDEQYGRQDGKGNTQTVPVRIRPRRCDTRADVDAQGVPGMNNRTPIGKRPEPH